MKRTAGQNNRGEQGPREKSGPEAPERNRLGMEGRRRKCRSRNGKEDG